VGKVKVDISVSLDGYAAGPDATIDDPLGKGGEQLHEWVLELEAWRRPHGREGGETGPESDLVEESIRCTGATIMGRRMFSGGSGTWGDDSRARGWWGDEPPFHHPVFVLTHHEREPLELKGTTFTFVTDGIEAALEQAREAAGDLDVHVAGGAEAVQQYLRAGSVEELTLHIAPVVLGGGRRLLEDVGNLDLEPVLSLAGPRASHLRYRVA
jgi:dihydrofolate reductase